MGIIACCETELRLSTAVHSPTGASVQRAPINPRRHFNADLDYTNTVILQSHFNFSSLLEGKYCLTFSTSAEPQYAPK